MNKKGQLGMQQIFFVMAFLFATAIFIVILYYVWGQIATPFEEAVNSVLPEGETTYNVSIMNSAVSGGASMFNVMFPFLILGLIIMSIVFAFNTESHPMFFFISIILLIVAIILAVVFSNVFQQITETTALNDASQEFNITRLFLKNFPIIIVIVAAITMFILFGMSRKAGTGGL